MSQRRASCSCGQLHLVCEGEPVRISMCHCLACQQRTGSVFAVQARFRSDQVRIAGRSKEYTRTGDSGSRGSFHFCPECGSTVYWLFDSAPEVVAVAVGAFADPGFPPPQVAVYAVRRHPWTRMPDLAIEQLD